MGNITKIPDLPVTIDGMGNGLITGLQGSGKSHFIITQILHDILRNTEQDVYLVNVKGVDIINDKLHIVDDTFNWVTDAVQNSIVIYDEAGKIKRFSNENKRINSDPEVLELTELRHHGKQVFFVAQDPLIVHPSLRKLLVRHIHFSNPYNDPDKTRGFVFTKVVNSFDVVNQSWRKAAITEFTHYLDPAIFPLYKSIDDGAKHIKKKQVNKKAQGMFRNAIITLVIAFVILCIGIFLAVFLYNSVTSDDDIDTDTDTDTVAQLPPLTLSEVQENTEKQELSAMTADELIRKREQELIASRLPSDYEIMQANESIAVAMAMKFKGVCKAYNRDGLRLSISDEECNYYLAESGRMIKPSNKALRANTSVSTVKSSAVASPMSELNLF